MKNLFSVGLYRGLEAAIWSWEGGDRTRIRRQWKILDSENLGDSFSVKETSVFGGRFRFALGPCDRFDLGRIAVGFGGRIGSRGHQALGFGEGARERLEGRARESGEGA